MRMPSALACLAALLAASAARPASPAPPSTVIPVPLPGGGGGIGFDDLLFARGIGRVVVPAGRSGNLDLIDPASRQVVAIGGFRRSDRFGGGHGEGTTSADEGRGHLFAIDRTVGKLAVVDPRARRIVASALLAADPDYVRFIAPTGELWVTQPDREQIEVFSLPAAGVPAPRHAAFIRVPGGPESLVVDAARGRAYTHLWNGVTLAVDLKSRAVVARWRNGCRGSRGIALDERRGLLFVGCAEGEAVVLDLGRGAVDDRFPTGAGVDIIAYDPGLGHLYVPAGRSATLTTLGISGSGKLSLLGTVAIAEGSHCAASDDRRQVWICDPRQGRLLLFKDTFPPASR
jgi:hypothetical protein